jgi:hypothetical protein
LTLTGASLPAREIVEAEAVGRGAVSLTGRWDVSNVAGGLFARV